MTLRVAIVGAGLMGQWHADAAVKAGARVAAIVDVDAGRAAAVASKHGECRVVADLGQATGLADVIHICSPTDTHAGIARQALEAGRHVLVEKPLASTTGDTASLLALAEARRVLLCPVHQFLFQDGVRHALSQVAEIGPLAHVRFTMCSAGAQGRGPAEQDRIALEILPHPMSLLRRLVAASLAGAEWSVFHPASGEIRALGRVGQLTTSVLVSMAGRPTVNRMELIGARGTIEVDLFHGFAMLRDGQVSRARKIAGPFVHAAGETGAAAGNLVRRAWRRESAYPGLRQLFADFYQAIVTGGLPPILPSETIDVAKTCERLAQLSIGSE